MTENEKKLQEAEEKIKELEKDVAYLVQENQYAGRNLDLFRDNL